MQYRLRNKKARKCGGSGKGNTQDNPQNHALGGRCVLLPGFKHFRLGQPYCYPQLEYPRKSHRGSQCQQDTLN